MVRFISISGLLLSSILGVARGAATTVDVPADLLEDKIQGGLLGEILGNLNGLPHENKYIQAPGNVTAYVPSLPEGARTDDDTDIEWVYVIEMQRGSTTFLPYDQIAGLWRRHMNTKIWCANLYARRLMDLGIEPPLTGRRPVNPWSDFNISGQFLCEAFGLIAPAMPQTAARIALHYTHVAIDGEPAQATQLFTGMIATAFVEPDIEKIVAAGIGNVDSASVVRRVVEDVRRWWRENPDDWRITWRKVHDTYMRHGGDMRDINGPELNTAAVIASLLYGRGDLVETLRLAFNFGWDADCNAATAGTVIGVIKGRRWMDLQGWIIVDRYRNTTRPGMPEEETIMGYGRRLTELARLVILQNGGEETGDGNGRLFRILTQGPASVEKLTAPADDLALLRRQLAPLVEKDLSGSERDRARAAYLAICLGTDEKLRASHADDWVRAVGALRACPEVVKCVFRAPPSAAAKLQSAFRNAGLNPATRPTTAQSN